MYTKKGGVMKRTLIASAIMLGLYGIGYCSPIEPYYSPHNRVWRSSSTTSYNSGVRIASGTVLFHGVVVEKAGTDSTIEVFDGNTSSGTATVGPSIDSTSSKNPEYDIVFSSGLIYNNIGTTAANITILWDWFIQPGQTP